MPRAPKKCGSFACTERVVSRHYCPEHTPTWTTSTRQGSTRASRKMRAIVLSRDPLCRCSGCRACTSGGCTRPSVEDDHVVNLAAGGTDDIENHAGMCRVCHRVKTEREARRGRG